MLMVTNRGANMNDGSVLTTMDKTDKLAEIMGGG